jgi:hypothetical protein
VVRRLPSSPLRNLSFDVFDGNALSAVEFSEAILDGLAKLKFVNRVRQGGVRGKFFCDFDENLLRAHKVFLAQCASESQFTKRFYEVKIKKRARGPAVQSGF